METRYFTPKQAERTLPLVRKIVADILAGGTAVRELCEKIGTGAEAHPEVVRLMDQLEELMAELESLGCTYKDWNFTEGLVDFPAMLGDREVYLCWKSDEPTLAFYHDRDSGFAGRQPIPEKFKER